MPDPAGYCPSLLVLRDRFHVVTIGTSGLSGRLVASRRGNILVLCLRYLL
jgi:hypothetical protein